MIIQQWTTKLIKKTRPTALTIHNMDCQSEQEIELDWVRVIKTI